MSAKVEARTLKGFRDYAPREQLARQAMFAKIQEVFERFGFLPLSTPVLEYKEILMNKYGDDEKLVYSFKDMGDRDVAMRYDLTVSLARFVAQNRGSISFPFKRYQIAPVWRAENTQKGRLREFYQCDVDIVGGQGEFLGTADAEVMACLCGALEALGIQNYELRLNDRFLIHNLARSEEEVAQVPELLRCVDKLDKIGLEEVNKLMVQRGISEDFRERALELLSWGKGNGFLDKVEKLDEAAAASVKFYRQLVESIVALGVAKEKVVFDPTIARGLDYYTSTVFEIVLVGVEGFGSIAGGGRYNDLLSTFSDDSLPAVGGSIGIDRLYEYLESLDTTFKAQGVDVVVFNLTESDWTDMDVLQMVNTLRENDISVDIYYESAKLDKQFKYAESKGAKFAVLLGGEEKLAGKVKLKNLATREQVELAPDEVLAHIKNT